MKLDSQTTDLNEFLLALLDMDTLQILADEDIHQLLKILGVRNRPSVYDWTQHLHPEAVDCIDQVDFDSALNVK